MPIQSACPKCQAVYTLSDDQEGKKVRCRKCQGIFVVPPSRPSRATAHAGPAPARVREPVKPRRDEEEDQIVDRPSRVPSRKAAPAADRSSASARSRGEELEDDPDERKDRPRRKAANVLEAGNVLLWVLVGLGSGVVALGILVVVVMFALSENKRPPATQSIPLKEELARPDEGLTVGFDVVFLDGAPVVMRGDLNELMVGFRDEQGKVVKPDHLTFSLSKNLANRVAAEGRLLANQPAHLTCRLEPVGEQLHQRVLRIELVGPDGKITKTFAEE
jgi:predicted Zn finger-like uncharacterized protein